MDNQMGLKSLVGTNYYFQIFEGKQTNLIHIGKTSYGYQFLFRWNEKYYKTYDEFMKLLDSQKIYNHFGRLVDKSFIMELIRDKKDLKSISQIFINTGNKNLLHILEESNDNKVISKHTFIDEDFGTPVSDFELIE